MFVAIGAIYWTCRSTTLIGDGLRHLPALRTIVPGTSLQFEPKPWLELYRNYYETAVVHNHVLFGLMARGGFAVSKVISRNGDAVVAMQFENCVAAALAAALFFLLLVQVGISEWIAVLVTTALSLTPVYITAGTNIAEAGLALPFFITSLLLLAKPTVTNRNAFFLGVTTALAADIYFLAGALVPCIAVALVPTQERTWLKKLYPSFVFLGVFASVFLGIWVGVLYFAGIHDPAALALAILRFPQQGTYGGFKLGSLLATPIGMAQSLFSILPDSFVGLRQLYRTAPTTLLLAAVASLAILGALAFSIFRLVKYEQMRRPVMLASLLSFLLIEAVCVEWDPYYLKLQLFAVIPFFLLLTAGLSGARRKWSVGLMGTLLLGIAISGIHELVLNRRPSLSVQNARKLHAVVGESLLITGWSSDVAHLWLYSNGTNIVSLPDFALARKLETERVEADLNGLISKVSAEHGKVFFYGIFDPLQRNLTVVYETRFRLNGFGTYLKQFEGQLKEIDSFQQSGGTRCLLYELNLERSDQILGAK